MRCAAWRPGPRRISADVIVSPSDGVVESTGPVDSGSRVFVKGQPYDVGELVGDPKDASRFAGGSFAVVYLSPRDYHRVHSPVDGAITRVLGIPGDLYPVNKIGERHVPRLFVRNNRVAIAIDTQGLGRVYVVMVGAVIVGRISVSEMDNVLFKDLITYRDGVLSLSVKLSNYIFITEDSLYFKTCLLYTSPSPRDRTRSRMPSSA
mgnify:CR=1 FL=1